MNCSSNFAKRKQDKKLFILIRFVPSIFSVLLLFLFGRSVVLLAIVVILVNFLVLNCNETRRMRDDPIIVVAEETYAIAAQTETKDERNDIFGRSAPKKRPEKANKRRSTIRECTKRMQCSMAWLTGALLLMSSGWLSSAPIVVVVVIIIIGLPLTKQKRTFSQVSGTSTNDKKRKQIKKKKSRVVATLCEYVCVCVCALLRNLYKMQTNIPSSNAHWVAWNFHHLFSFVRLFARFFFLLQLILCTPSSPLHAFHLQLFLLLSLIFSMLCLSL